MKTRLTRLFHYAALSVARLDGDAGGVAQMSGRSSGRLNFGSAATRRLQSAGEARR